jgi:hypothetical protein
MIVEEPGVTEGPTAERGPRQEKPSAPVSEIGELAKPPQQLRERGSFRLSFRDLENDKIVDPSIKIEFTDTRSYPYKRKTWPIEDVPPGILTRFTTIQFDYVDGKLTKMTVVPYGTGR